jgi:hypothetical protein
MLGVAWVIADKRRAIGYDFLFISGFVAVRGSGSRTGLTQLASSAVPSRSWMSALNCGDTL